MTRSSLILASVLLAAIIAVSPAAGTSSETPMRGGTLVVGLPGLEPACLNVLVERCEGGLVVEKVLESPFAIGPDLTFRPQLVSGVDTTKTRPFTLTYHIRPEAHWSDGMPVMARDFVFTLRAIREHGPPATRKLHQIVRSIRVVDRKTLRVILRARFAGWRSLFGPVLPSHVLRGENLEEIWSDGIDNPRTGKPIGSGPFVIERWERGNQLTLARNPRYWGGHTAYLNRIIVRLHPVSSDLTEALVHGELDMAQGVSPATIPALRREPGLRVETTPALGFEHFELQLGPRGHPALKSKLVRRALAYGIDRVAIAREVLADTTAPNPLESAVLPAPSRYYEPNWSGYRYRPVLARRLLDEAGCRRGEDGIYSCAGERLALRILAAAGNERRTQTLELVQGQLHKIGVAVSPSFFSSAAWFPVLADRDWDLFLFSFVYSSDSAGIEDVFGCGRDYNYSGYCQRLVTEDLDQSSRILDDRQRARVLNRADRQIAKDVPVIPLFQYPYNSVRTSDLRNYVLPPDSPLWKAENWWLER